MSEFRFACPSCGQRIAGDPAYRGTQITCPSCRQTITVPNPVARAAIPQAVTHAPLPDEPAKASEYSRMALLSFVCSLGGFLGCLPAIMFGNRAREEIRAKPALRGKALAIAGLVISYCVLALTAGCFLYVVVVMAPKHGRQLTAEQQAALAPAVAARLVDEVKLADTESEGAHAMKVRNGGTTKAGGMTGMTAYNGGFLSYSMQVDPNERMSLDCTYWGSADFQRRFDVLVNEHVIGTQELQANDPKRFFDVIYKIPAGLTRGQTNVTVVFQAYPSYIAGGVFGLKMLKP